jgi:hypothetical protein
MNIGPLGAVNTGAAGSPLAQTKGSEVERTEQQLGARQRQVYHGRKAEAAAGVGEPDGEDHEATERDADGRRPWEEPAATNGDVAEPKAHPSKDPSQQSGNLLDLSG